MQTKSRGLAQIFFSIILIFLGTNLFAQSPNEEREELSFEENLGIGLEGNAQSETASANKIRQPFSWENMGDVLYYEILIERYDEETDSYEQCFFHKTTEEETERCTIYLDPILPPGRYRSRISVYNVLGGLEEDLTTQDDFVVRQAYMPEIKDISYPLYMRSIIYLDDFDNDGILDIEGKNLFLPEGDDPDAAYTKYFLSGMRIVYPIKVISHDENNKKITLQFDMKYLDVGTYNLFAQDASGLHSEPSPSTELVVKFKKWIDFDIEAGYIFPIVAHDLTLPEYVHEKFFPVSVQARASLIFLKRLWGYMGVGTRVNYSYFNSKVKSYRIEGNKTSSHLVFMYQIPMFKRRAFFEFHGKAELTYFNNVEFHFPSGKACTPIDKVDHSNEERTNGNN